MYKNAKIIVNAIIIMAIGVTMANSSQEFDFKPKGTLFYSNGADLLKYNFSTNKKEMLFSQEEGLASNREISNILFPNYLKSKNRIIAEGYGIVYGRRIFECDLNGNNWIEYENLKNIEALSISPDDSKVAYARYIKPQDKSKIVLPKDYRYQLIIKKYDDLNKSDHEQVVAEDFAGNDPCVWESNDVILYRDLNRNTVRLDLITGEKKVILNGLAPAGITNDRKLLLCTGKGKIRTFGITSKTYLVQVGDYTPILLKKFDSSINSILIWSPDNRYFIFTKTRPFSLHELKDIWIYDLKTGKEKLLIKYSSSLFGGFWLE